MTGQFPGGKYLDDIDPEQLTDEQKQALIDLRDRDPYAFYNLWRDPDEAQRRFEGDDFITTPASELYKQIGALKMAGAPENVVQYWQDTLEKKNRETEDTSAYPPKVNPIQDKLDQIEKLCERLHEVLNHDETYTYDPDEDDVFLETPWASKWQAVMRVARGEPLNYERHHGYVRHYKDSDSIGASMGCEIVEIVLNDFPAEFDLDELYANYIHPSGADIDVIEAGVRIKLEFYNCYE